MNYPPRGPLSPQQAISPGSSAYSQSGSVRAVKERLAEVQRKLQEGITYNNNRRQDVGGESILVSQYSPMRSPQPRMESIGRFGIEAFETDSELPSSDMRWPLADEPRPEPSTRSQDQMKDIGPLTFLDTMDESPEAVQREWKEQEALSPSSLTSPNRPPTNSSHASTTSSLGSIPDFPFPGQPAPRRSQNLGPPPAARRGQSAYYSQVSLVSPIQEEMDNRSSIRSFASSNVIPASIPDFYLEEGESPSDEEDPRASAFPQPPSSGFDNQSGLVRQASLGKRGRPALTTIGTREPQRSANQPIMESIQTNTNQQGSDGPQTRTGPVPDLSPTTSEESLVKKGRRRADLEAQDILSKDIYVPGPSASPTDTRVDHILGALGKGGSLSNEALSNLRQAKKSSLAERVGSRRPARLNVEAVREAEARSSLTSLPELIRRATRLAANLDRGKTASRIGPEMMLLRNQSTSPSRSNANLDFEKPNRNSNDVGVDGIRPILPQAVFASNDMQSSREWLSAQSQQPVLASSDQQSTPGKRKRRWCGLSPLVFSLVVILIVVLIAAAVIIPIALVVLPQRTAPATRSISCAKSTSCQNQGTSLLMPDGTCGCLCTNGFTGSKCTTASDAACITMDTGGVKSATVGNQIPRLMQAASTFSIPLVGSMVLAQFSKWNTSCSAENALVTFPGYGTSKRALDMAIEDYDLGLVERADPQSALQTSKGIVIEATATLIPAPKASATPAAAPAGTAPVGTIPINPTPASPPPAVVTPGSGNTPAPGTNSTSRDFARIGILYVLQDSQTMEAAVVAQEQLSNYMTSATKRGSTIASASNINLGNGYSINLWDMTVTLKNGTVYGNGWNGTATVLQRPS